MKSRAMALLALLMLALFLVPYPSVSAKATIPESFHSGFSIQRWPGTVNGARSKFWIDVPTMAGGETWERYLQLTTQDGNDWFQFGVESCGSSTRCTFCKASGFWIFLFASSTGQPAICYTIPADMKNTAQYFAIYDNSVRAGDYEFQIFNAPSDAPCGTLPCSIFTAGFTWYYIDLKEYIYASFGTGQHKVYGGFWLLNQWMDSNYNFKYQTVDGSFIAISNPPQMGWDQPPRLSNTGGSLISCDYDTGTYVNCKYRG
jgi:hypothetical protein